MRTYDRYGPEAGSIEIITLTLMTVLVVLVALPLLSSIGVNVRDTLSSVNEGYAN